MVNSRFTAIFVSFPFICPGSFHIQMSKLDMAFHVGREAGKVIKLTAYYNAGEHGNNPGDDSPFLVQQDIQFFFLQRTLVT